MERQSDGYMKLASVLLIAICASEESFGAQGVTVSQREAFGHMYAAELRYTLPVPVPCAEVPPRPFRLLGRADSIRLVLNARCDTLPKHEVMNEVLVPRVACKVQHFPFSLS
jgi:hypothetical protein